MLQRMGRRAGAVGFAIYLDLLEGLDRNKRHADVDVLLLYDESTVREAAEAVAKLTAEGKSVSAQKAIPPTLRYRETEDLRKGAK